MKARSCAVCSRASGPITAYAFLASAYSWPHTYAHPRCAQKEQVRAKDLGFSQADVREELKRNRC